jgi:hypothetical protein
VSLFVRDVGVLSSVDGCSREDVTDGEVRGPKSVLGGTGFADRTA